MAPSEGQKRQKGSKVNSDAHHSQCKLHVDNEDRLRVCNGIKINGKRCTSKIKDKAKCEFMKQTRLPVCGVHASQNLMLGHCQATAECGHKCNRLVETRPGYNQLCEEHKDVTLECHILKLPSELRLIIIDLILPAGPVRFPGRRGYRTAHALLETSKEISSEVSLALYKSKHRPCVAVVGGDKVEVLGTAYGQAISDHNSLLYSDYRHITHLDLASFGLFEYVRVIIYGGLVLAQNDDYLHSMLEVFRRTMNALVL